MRSFILLSALLLSLSGCAAFRVVEIDGFKVLEKYTLEHMDVVRNRAAFDLSCPAGDLALTILSVDSNDFQPTSIGVSGCEKQAVYVRPEDTDQWVLNSTR